MRKNVLFVSIAFPPKNDSEALQVAKYFHYLQQHPDLNIDVVTSALPTLYMPYDADMEHYATGVRQLIAVTLKENRYVNFLLNRLNMQDRVFPDSRFSFHLQYKKVLSQLKEKPDIIYSRSEPRSSTIMAYKLRQELKVPWILHMSDPWADCPMHVLEGKNYRINKEWEKKCFEAADLICLTSYTTIAFYKKIYPHLAHKFRFYPNVFDGASLKNESPKTSLITPRKFRIVYTGGVVTPIGPEYLLKPLKELYEQDPSIGERIEVIFAGEADSDSRNILQQYGLPFVSWIGKVPFKQALELQQSADYLLAIDNPVEDPEKAMFFLSKLLDYMVARKRILLLTTRGSASDQVIKDIKGDSCWHYDVAAIKKAILKSLEAFEKGDAIYLSNETPPATYEASFNADRLYQEILQLVDSSPKKSYDRAVS